MDRGLRYQQNLLKLPIAVVLLVVPDNSIESILPLIAEAKRAAEQITGKEFVIVGEK